MTEERKLVTILFADVTGSTSLGEELDPEDVRALMGRYYDHAQHVIPAHGGTLEKFIGDAVMAVFGLPQAYGDDAERAVAAACALRDAVGTDPFLSARIQLRVGVNTGEVVATTNPAGSDFLVTGDAVNVAARLQQSANPGEILAAERTADAAQSAFLFGRERQIRARGKTQRLRAFPVGTPRAVRRIPRPPFVGRRQDLLQLELLRTRAVEERQPQLVSILAPAGTGKSRLVEEFLDQLDATTGFQVAFARCPPYGQTLTYWPLRGLLTELLGTSADPGTKAVAQAFASAGHAPADAEHLAARVLATLGIERDGGAGDSADREATFNAWRLLVEALARQAPRILVFDNLHWASNSLLDLVEHIMHPRTQAPLLIIALSRPELLDRRPAWGGGRPNFTALALRPLSDEQTRDLVGRLVEGLPEPLRRQIAERSGGNPFFAIELAREHAESALSGDEVGLALPDTVHAAILARLDRLSPNERAVLQAASVAARTFYPAMLLAVLDGVRHEALDAALDQLVAGDLIAPAEGDAYTFRHILIREVAYGTLARAERVRLHAGIAAWLESYAAGRVDEFAELIAYHYREAVVLARQSAVPLALPIRPDRAVHFLERAAVLASRSGAYVEARNHLESAITLAPETEHVHLYEHLGDCIPPDVGTLAAEAYEKALERWRAADAPNPLTGARLNRKLLMAATRWGAWLPGEPQKEEVLARLLREAQRLSEVAGDAEERWRVRLAAVYFDTWHATLPPELAALNTSRAVALEAASHFERLCDWTAFSESLDIYAWLSMNAGDHDGALRSSERRLAALDLSAAERGDALSMIARAYFNLGQYDECIATIRDGLANLRPGESVAPLATGGSRAPHIMPFAFGISRAAQAAWYVGRWDELEAFRPAAEQALEETQHEPGRGLTWYYFVALHIALAREDRSAADAASAMFERLFDSRYDDEWYLLFRAYRADDPAVLLEPRQEVWPDATLYPETLMFLSERDVAAPPELLQPAGEEARRERIAFPLHCAAIAEALAAQDYARLATAIDEAEASQMIPHAARMRIVLAQHNGDRAQLERARPVLERLADRQFLRRLAEIEATC
jgi:class 3 adenylate cyclase